MTDTYVSAREARERIGVSRETMRRLLTSGRLDAFKAGDSPTSPYRVSESSLEAWIEIHGVAGREEAL